MHAGSLDDDESFVDGLPSLVLSDDAVLRRDGGRLGPRIQGGAASDRALIYEAIRRPEAWLALGEPGSPDGTPPLFRFAFSHAQHCRSISGCETRILAPCRSAVAFDAIRTATRNDQIGVPIAVLLRAEPRELWLHALRGV